MGPLDMIKLPSITGGAAAPSSAMGAPTYLTMNSPFSVAGQGGKANSTASAASEDMTLIIMALIVGAVVLVVAK